MGTQMGEYIVGAYLAEVKGCSIVQYNVRPAGGGLNGLNELDVIGIDLSNNIVYLCEVTTHIRGLYYGDYNKTVEKIIRKFHNQKRYAKSIFSRFCPEFMFWSPIVQQAVVNQLHQQIQSKGILLQLIINEEYTARINELIAKAKKQTQATNNPAFRMLQILEHLK